MPSPYVVSLVGSEGRTEGKNTIRAVEQTRVPAPPKENSSTPRKAKTPAKEEEQLVSDRIAALKAKKKIEDIVKLRNVISLKGSGEGKQAPPLGAGAKGGGSLIDDYYAKLHRDIWQNWIFPDTTDKNLEAIVSIRIMKDGSVQATRVEKSSGNRLFDRSALRAIAKASPVTPPPYEMEVGVRFYP